MPNPRLPKRRQPKSQVQNGSWASEEKTEQQQGSEGEELCRTDNQDECEHGDGDFADETYSEGPKALFAHLAEVGAQADTSEGQEERPAGEVGERVVLVFAKEADGGQKGDQEEA